MTLDVIIPTYNRAALLRRTLESLLAAEQPPGLTVTVTVCDNRSTDDTPAAVSEFQERFGERLRYVYEAMPGRSPALNAGIESTDGDLVAMIDDDEEVDHQWLCCIARVFTDSSVDFIGGPYVPNWTSTPPAWVPATYGAVIGRVDCGVEIRQYGAGFDGMLMGGNAVVRRSLLDRVGPYRVDLGRTPNRLMSCEDEDMFKRLVAAGARGFYRPDLIIHHYVAPERVTRSYFRRWCFWRGVSLGILDRRQSQDVAYAFGVPRYMFGVAARAAADNLRNLFARRNPARRFANELAWWDLIGFIYGRHWARPTRPAARPVPQE